MPISNDPVQANLMKIRGLQTQHFKDTIAVDLVGYRLDLSSRVVGAAKLGRDQVLAVSVQQLERLQVSTGGDLDELGEAISDLRLGQSAKKGEVEKSVHRSMVSSETVLVVAIVDRNLDRDGRVDQADDGGGNTDEIGVPAVDSACESNPSHVSS